MCMSTPEVTIQVSRVGPNAIVEGGQAGVYARVVYWPVR